MGLISINEIETNNINGTTPEFEYTVDNVEKIVNTYRITRLEIRNFQSIEHIVYNFNDRGLIAFMGSNDIGKSAVFRALAVLLLNPFRSVKDFVRTGCSTFYVGIELSNGVKISTTRGIINKYEWTLPDGTTKSTTKLEGTVPIEVAELLNLYTEPVTDTSLNYRTTDEPLLVVNQKGSQVYAIIEDSLNTSVLGAALKLAGKDLLALSKEMESKKFQIELIEKRASEIQIFDEALLLSARDGLIKNKDIFVTIESLIAKSAKLKELEDTSVDITPFENKINTISDSIKIYNIVISLLTKYASINIIENTLSNLDCSGIENGLGEVVSLNSTYSLVSHVINIYKSMDGLEKEDDLLSDIFKLKDNLDKCKVKLDSIYKYTSNLININKLNKSYTIIEEVISKTEYIAKEKYKIDCINNLFSKIKSLECINNEIKEVNSKIKEETINLSNVILNIGKCPVCNNNISSISDICIENL